MIESSSARDIVHPSADTLAREGVQEAIVLDTKIHGVAGNFFKWLFGSSWVRLSNVQVDGRVKTIYVTQESAQKVFFADSKDISNIGSVLKKMLFGVCLIGMAENCVQLESKKESLPSSFMPQKSYVESFNLKYPEGLRSSTDLEKFIPALVSCNMDSQIVIPSKATTEDIFFLRKFMRARRAATAAPKILIAAVDTYIHKVDEKGPNQSRTDLSRFKIVDRPLKSMQTLFFAPMERCFTYSLAKKKLEKLQQEQVENLSEIIKLGPEFSELQESQITVLSDNLSEISMLLSSINTEVSNALSQIIPPSSMQHLTQDASLLSNLKTFLRPWITIQKALEIHLGPESNSPISPTREEQAVFRSLTSLLYQGKKLIAFLEEQHDLEQKSSLLVEALSVSLDPYKVLTESSSSPPSSIPDFSPLEKEPLLVEEEGQVKKLVQKVREGEPVLSGVLASVLSEILRSIPL